MKFVFLLSLVFFLSESQNLRGIDLSVLENYKKTTFQCDDSKIFSSNIINDDYCDCLDGTDEPGTSACPNGFFYCINEKHISQKIFSSRVNDGICDCCDGSDEYFLGSCENTCEKAWEESTKQYRQEIEEHEAGINFVKQKQDEYKNEIQSKKIELESKLSAKSTLQPTIDSLNTQKTYFQTQIQSKTEEIKNIFSALIESLVSEEFENEKSKISENPPEASQDAPPPEPLYADEENLEGKEGGTDGTEGTEGTEGSVEISEEEKQRKVEEEKQRIRERITNAKLDENVELKKLKEELETLENDLQNKNRELSDIENSIKEIENFISFDFGPSSIFSYMYGQSYSFVSNEYTYTLNSFKEVTQGHTRVGYWGSWRNEYSQMFYERGERCWGGPDRSIVVNLLCGGETKILEVKEPAKCEYEMKVKTPGACTEKNLEELKKKL